MEPNGCKKTTTYTKHVVWKEAMLGAIEVGKNLRLGNTCQHENAVHAAPIAVVAPSDPNDNTDVGLELVVPADSPHWQPTHLHDQHPDAYEVADAAEMLNVQAACAKVTPCSQSVWYPTTAESFQTRKGAAIMNIWRVAGVQQRSWNWH